jgi:hypothetical protein
LREDHSLTKPFFDKVSELIVDLLMSYMILNTKKKTTHSLDNIVIDVVGMWVRLEKNFKTFLDIL